MDELSDRQLRLAYWWATHRDGLHRFFVGTFIVCVIVLWAVSLFLWIRFFVYEGRFQRAMEAMGQGVVNPLAFLAMPEARPQPLTVGAVQMIALTDGREDRVVQVTNPNALWIAYVRYQLGDDRRMQTTIVLPGEMKLLTDLGISVTARAEFIGEPVRAVQWNRLSTYPILSQERLKFRIHAGDEGEESAPQFFPAGAVRGLPVDRATFTVTNDSALTYINPKFIVSVSNGEQIVGVNTVTIDPLQSQETRTVDVRWLSTMDPATVSSFVRVQVDPDVDITDPSQFF